VWTVLVNFFGTMTGKWHEFGRNLPAKFLIMGSLMYLVGCFPGLDRSLALNPAAYHFSDFVISHSHLTVFGTFVVWAMASDLTSGRALSSVSFGIHDGNCHSG